MTTEAQLLEDDRNARRCALDVSRSFIVQAPAGSGKTELLIQRYLCLLATVDNPEEILAITFTRKAAAEMRLRVLGALRSAQAGEQPTAPHQETTHKAALAVLQRDSELDWGLMLNPGRMRMQTLDSLNSSIARMQPLTASSGGGAATVVDESEMRLLYEQAATATLDWLAEDNANGAAAREVLLHADSNTGIYIGQLARMLRTRDQWLPFVGAGQLQDDEARTLRRTFESALEDIITERITALRNSVPLDAAAEFLALAAYAAENLRADGKEDDPICALAASAELPGTSIDSLPLWQGLAEFLLTKSGSLRKQVNKNQGFPPKDAGQKAAMTDLLTSLAEEQRFIALLAAVRELPPATYSETQWAVLVSLFRLLPLAVAELRRLSLARGITDYVEIAMCAGDALGDADNPGDIALLLDYQVRHILVDEMQDTSRAQYRMLEALTGGWQPGDGRTLFCVGDPMQSIYRFRNAEVSQFLLARTQGIGSVRLEPLLLRRNFRSGEKLVEWFNDVFSRVLPERDDAVNGAVSYSTAVPVEAQAGQGEFAIYPVFGSSVKAEAEAGAEVVGRTLREYPGDNVAVLVRSRTQLPALLHQFREASIAYQAVDIDRLSDRPEIIDILALTRAITHPGDRLAWLAVLRSPWIGLDWTDLHTLVRNEPNKSVLELLRDDERRQCLSSAGQAALSRGLGVLEEQLRADRSTPLHRRVERAWFELGGPALLNDESAVVNVYQYIDALSKYESGGSISDVAVFMQHLDAERVSTHQVARVQVMTMHKSKGLQFDHVVLYGLGRFPAGNDTSVLSWLDLPDDSDVDRKLVSAIGRRDELERDPLHQFIERTEAAKDRHENGRLLYVACTRARKSLHLLGNVSVSADEEGFSTPRISSLLYLLWPIVADDFEQAFAKRDALPTDNESSVLVPPPFRRFVSDWQLPADVTVPGQVTEPERTTEEQRVEYYWVGADARLAGTVVHRWLQRFADGRMALTAQSFPSIRVTSRRWLCELGAGQGELDAICDRVVDALEGVLNDEQGRWLLQGEGASELALSGLRDQRIESIVIDRIRIDEEGTHWIVDYKTSSHEGGNLEGFLAAEVDRYRFQIRKYAGIYRSYRPSVKLRGALYFPLLQRLVEVDVD